MHFTTQLAKKNYTDKEKTDPLLCPFGYLPEMLNKIKSNYQILIVFTSLALILT